MFVLLGLALHVEGLGAQRVQERSTKAAAVASDFVLGRGRDRPLCPNGMDLASCLQFASGGAAAAKARATSDAATMGGIPITVDRLLNSIERKRPKVGWEGPVLSLPC